MRTLETVCAAALLAAVAAAFAVSTLTLSGTSDETPTKDRSRTFDDDLDDYNDDPRAPAHPLPARRARVAGGCIESLCQNLEQVDLETEA